MKKFSTLMILLSSFVVAGFLIAGIPAQAAGYVGLSQSTMNVNPGVTYQLIGTSSSELQVVDTGISVGTTSMCTPTNGGYLIYIAIGADEPVGSTVAFLFTSADPAGGIPGTAVLYCTVKAKGQYGVTGITTTTTATNPIWTKQFPYGYEYLTSANSATIVAAIMDETHAHGSVFYAGKRLGSFVVADETGLLYPMYLSTPVPYVNGSYIGMDIANPYGRTLTPAISPTDKAILIQNGIVGLMINGVSYPWP